jgi:nicotinate-nucleotide--dimethylbenzimidazole phosphoribosyltransferase
VLVAAITGAEPVAVVGRGSGIDDETWMRKAAAIRDALRRARPHVRDPLGLVRVAGGADLGVLAGFLVQAAARRTPVLLDGLVPIAAALIADELAPGARDWWLLAGRSPEPALALAAGHLELTPVLDLQIRLDDGAGAVAAVPLLAMSARLLAETATAADSGITPAARAEV